MRNYNLGFISDLDLYSHVQETVRKYRFNVDLAAFNHNLIDPIKLTFDAKVYRQEMREVIAHEVARQVDKSNTMNSSSSQKTYMRMQNSL